MARKIRDALLTVVKACPAAGSAHNTDTIDLEATGPAALESTEVLVEVPALPNLTGTDKYVTIKLQDSADNSSYADIPSLASFAIQGVASTGPGATSQRFKLPSTVRRYLQANIAVTSAGGTNTGQSVTVSLLT